MSWRMDRLYREVLAIGLNYGAVQWDNVHGLWVGLEALPVPASTGKAATHLLLTLPPEYPKLGPAGTDFFVDRGLSLRDKSHYRETGHRKAAEGWAWLCLEIDGWNPSADIWKGDNLLKLCQTVGIALAKLA